MGDFPGQEVAVTDWDPDRYAAFRELRLRPALDLLAKLPPLPEGCVIDLGCGEGAVAPALAARFPGRARIGVDASTAMLEAARATGAYTRLELADIATWQAERPAALIFSNAALNWVPEHAQLMPRLAGMLKPGGVLAVQMPRQFEAPSHRLLAKVAEALFPGRFQVPPSPVLPSGAYADMLVPLGRVTDWTTDYLQFLDPVAEGHPVRAFTEATAMRPFAQGMTAEEKQAFVAAYDTALAAAYPVQPDGRVVFPFTRVFFLLEKS